MKQTDKTTVAGEASGAQIGRGASGMADAEGDVFLISAPVMNAHVTGYDSLGAASFATGDARAGDAAALDLALLDLPGQVWPVEAHYDDSGIWEPALATAPSGVAGWTMMTGPDFRDAVAEASFGDLLFNGRRMAGLSTMKFEGDGSVRNLRNAAVSLGHFVELEIAEDLEEDIPADPLGSGPGLPSWRLPVNGLSGSGEATFGPDLGPMMVTVVNGVPFVVAGGEAGNAFAMLPAGGADPLTATEHVLHGIDTGVAAHSAAYDEVSLPDRESIPDAGGAPPMPQGATAEADHPAVAGHAVFDTDDEDGFHFRSFDERVALAEAAGPHAEHGHISEGLVGHIPDEAFFHAADPGQAADDVDLSIAALDVDHPLPPSDTGDLPF